MRFLIFSDSHGRDGGMLYALRLHPDVRHVLFLGDGLLDVSRVAARHPGLHIRAVRGNMDALSLDTSAEDEDVFSVFGVNVMMMHGHLFGVKGGTAAAESYALRRGAHVLLYGHTHSATSHYDGETGLYTFNPGSIGHPYAGTTPSFGLLDILPNGQISLSHGSIAYK